MMLFWRAWHLRNNVIFGNGKASVEGSAQYLVNYLESFGHIRRKPDNGKGKSQMNREGVRVVHKHRCCVCAT